MVRVDAGVSRRAVMLGGLAVAGGSLFASQAFAVPREEAGDPLRVGVLLALTGPFAAHSERLRLGIEYQAEIYNADAAARPVELFVRDTAGDVETARGLATALIEQDRVHALIGTSGPTTTPPVLEIAQAAAIPIVVPVAGIAVTEPYAFVSAPSRAQNAGPMMRAIAAGGSTRVGLLGIDATLPETWAALAEAAAANGLTIVKEARFPITATDLTTQIGELLAADAEVIAVNAPPPFNGLAVKNAGEVNGGTTPPMICGPEAGHPGFLESAGGAAAEGVRMIAPWLLAYTEAPDTLPNIAEMRAFGKGFEDAHGLIGSFVGFGADALGLLAAAFGADSDPVAARDRLETLSFNGVGGRYEMSPDKHAGLTDDSLTTIVVRDGRWHAEA